MNAKLRILTFHHIPNNGAFLYAYSLVNHLKERFSSCDVRIIDYRTTRLALFEYLKSFKLFSKEPLFYYKRYRLWANFLENQLDLDKSYPRFSGEKQVQRYYSRTSDALLVGMDVWCIINGTPRPRFPNIYWLPEKMEIPKLAYGVSCYYSDRSLIEAHGKEITTYLNDFEVVGSRDRFTHEMVLKYRTRTSGLVERVPDPTFLCNIPKTGVTELVTSLGIDLNRPVLGLLLSRNDQLSERICSHYRGKGYQIVALSMYNPHADINLGHIINPFQWAELFGYLSFGISDRFHGAVFCIKNEIPFISLENERIPREQSKLYDLLIDFGLTSCYERLHDGKYSISRIMSRISEIEGAWEKSLRPSINSTRLDMVERYRIFSDKMRSLLGW